MVELVSERKPGTIFSEAPGTKKLHFARELGRPAHSVPGAFLHRASVAQSPGAPGGRRGAGRHIVTLSALWSETLEIV
jgi:hypothetical protein